MPSCVRLPNLGLSPLRKCLTFQNRDHILCHGRVQPGRWFVAEEQRRIGQDFRRERQPLHLATRDALDLTWNADRVFSRISGGSSVDKMQIFLLITWFVIGWRFVVVQLEDYEGTGQSLVAALPAAWFVGREGKLMRRNYIGGWRSKILARMLNRSEHYSLHYSLQFLCWSPWCTVSALSLLIGSH